MTKKEVLALIKEMNEEEKKTERRPHYYMRKGKMLERSYPDYIYTERYKELFFSDESPIRTANIFKCECCGKYVNYFALEWWICDFDTDEYECSMCYENEMGDNL